ncbi:MAG: transketolase [Leptospiraceae bacterium]|nr:transketolase [Leptospiraceae bacterium]
MNLSIDQLESRANTIRRKILQMVHSAGCGHPGGPLGLADIFTVLFMNILRLDPKQATAPARDRFILSNGHVSAVLYAAMQERGFWPDLDIMSFRSLGSPFQGHPSTRYLEGIENCSGSLGQGLSVASGLSLGLKQQGQAARVFCCISDGECGEGMTWEAATAAAHYKAPVIAFMDWNGIQIDGYTRDVCHLGDLPARFQALGWQCSTVDGHDIQAIQTSLLAARSNTSGPQIIFFQTTLGKGISFMENQPGWHGKAPNDAEMQSALAELV